MATLLKIDVSPRGDSSISRQLGSRFATEWQSNHVGGEIVTRDLATTKIPYVDLPWIAGAFSAPDQHTAEHKAALKISDELIGELLSADEVLITTPMYNFSTPAILKAWIDHIVRLNKTFSFGPEGLKGLAAGKKVTIIIASGSEYTAGSPLESYNIEGPYFRVIFGFIGITDLTIVHAGGTNKVAQGEVTAPVFVEKFIHEVDLAAAK
ncbi:FMN-dependent NADH-azoreductase [Tunturibacter empetritectus]|uniref:FMN dependent NADH:quinone oxidoreductase n=1 Tax=Tunturiibacter empetritectus TaxID=3069691 RepID=A0A7W8MSM3_9BACT|nr:NAD(P)H-dependent oxidoreductase [Edaphobacter lichenicola]MBB5318507.1 FMN-dependent NADH-azoreductase [Edaphobacter lichenicola]